MDMKNRNWQSNHVVGIWSVLVISWVLVSPVNAQIPTGVEIPRGIPENLQRFLSTGQTGGLNNGSGARNIQQPQPSSPQDVFSQVQQQRQSNSDRISGGRLLNEFKHRQARTIEQNFDRDLDKVLKDAPPELARQLRQQAREGIRQTVENPSKATVKGASGRPSYTRSHAGSTVVTAQARPQTRRLQQGRAITGASPANIAPQPAVNAPSAVGASAVGVAASSNLSQGNRLKQERIIFEKNWAAAHTDNIQAQFNVGQMLYRGQGVGQNKEQAYIWIRKAADKQYMPAIDALAIYTYQDGYYDEALKYLHAIEHKKSVETYLTLADMYAKGLGTQEDTAKSGDYIMKAANIGHIPSQERVFEEYRGGKDVVEAYKWGKILLEHNPSMQKKVIELRQKLSPEQLSQAKERITAWQSGVRN